MATKKPLTKPGKLNKTNPHTHHRGYYHRGADGKFISKPARSAAKSK